MPSTLRFALLLSLAASLEAADPAKPKPEDVWDTTMARGKVREIDFTTGEGTWMSVDLSPDGQWIVFDLLAHVYRVPASGGTAECLTQSSGAALNFHPRLSPDGRTIAFVSDRKGQNNLWLMDLDGKNPRPVFDDKDVRVYEPAWTPDGQYLVVRREQFQAAAPTKRGLWMYHRDGGSGIELVGKDTKDAEWPSVSPDGRYVYFDASDGPETDGGRRDVLLGTVQLKRLELKTGTITEVTAGRGQQQYRSSSGGAIAPEVSPDGRLVAFARRIPDGTLSYKGHRFGPRTALWIRDLETGAERLAMDPIEMDTAEGYKSWRALPGYAWARDGTSIVISQGGKLRRLDLASGNVATIPFTARVHRALSEMAYHPFTLSDGPFEAKFLRWPTASPDGRSLVFQAVGKLWIQDLPAGTPRRLTEAAFKPFEHAPAWSPDGRWIAFTSWDDAERAQLWKVPAEGGAPLRLTTVAGEYLNPAWSPDGQDIVVARGAGETAHGRTLQANPWWDLVRVPAAGGADQPVVRVADFTFNERAQIVRPSFTSDGRVFYPEQTTEKGPEGEGEKPVTRLLSVKLDGTDKRTHLTFPFADEIAVSPDGRWAAFQEGDNVYLTALPLFGTGKEPTRLEKKTGRLPVKTLSKRGGLFPRWRTPTVVEYGSGSTYFTYDLPSEKTQSVTLKLTVPRRVPEGSLALTNARIVTLENRSVIEQGSILVKGGRIACVGACDSQGADRVIDLSGKTVIPGLVDMHAHHYSEYKGVIPPHAFETAVYLAYGVTTNLDNSTWSENVFPTAELTEAGLVAGPRTFSTGDPLYRGDGSRQNDIASYEVAEQEIARLQSWGAVTLKQYLQPRRDQRQWISDIARKRGMMVTAEGDSLEYDLSMILDGQTGWEHPMGYAVLYGDATQFFGRAKATYSPTFIVAGPGPWNEEYFYQSGDVWRDEKLRRFMPWMQLVPHTRRRVLRPETDYSFPMIAQALADLIAQGGYGAIGSHGQLHGIGSHWETWMAASALGPMGALEVASLHGARFLGLDKDLGSIKVGKLADLLVLDANPLDDIRNTARIRYVAKGGVLYDAATLDEVWPTATPFAPTPWINPDALRSDDRAVDYWDKR